MQPFLNIGGSYETFWSLTPRTIQFFFKAHEEKTKEQIRLAWIQGIYVKQAIQSSIVMVGLADRKAISKMPKYPEETPFTPKKELSKEEQLELIKNKMEKWTKLNNKSRK